MLKIFQAIFKVLFSSSTEQDNSFSLNEFDKLNFECEKQLSELKAYHKDILFQKAEIEYL